MYRVFILKFNKKLKRFELWINKKMVEASCNRESLYRFAKLNGYKIKEKL